MKFKDLSEIKTQNLNDKMSQWFARFAEQCSGSNMYEHLSRSIATDNELLAIAAQGNLSQPIPNLFLAAVHYLLFKNKNEFLASFYPSLGGRFVDSSEFFIAFKNFVLKFSDEIINLTKSKTVQTNEVRRCAQLMAGLSLISDHNGNRSMTLIDVGTSSGLNLLMDQYSYSFNGVSVGNSHSELHMSCRIKGRLVPIIKVPHINRRIGIDLNPIDLAVPDERLWAKALMWPDQSDRLERLEKAIAVRLRHHLEMMKTDGNEVLEKLLSKPDDMNETCIMHSFTLNQFTEAQRRDFEDVLKKGSKQNVVWRLSLEWIGTAEPELKIQKFKDGRLAINAEIATCHGHGEWIEFKKILLT